MADLTGKSYNETAPRGAEVDLTEQRALEAVRAAKRDGTLGEAYGSDSLGERIGDGVATARETIRGTASNLYGEATSMVRGRAGEVAAESRAMLDRWVDQRPVQLVLGAALVGFLFGKFG